MVTQRMAWTTTEPRTELGFELESFDFSAGDRLQGTRGVVGFRRGRRGGGPRRLFRRPRPPLRPAGREPAGGRAPPADDRGAGPQAVGGGRGGHLDRRRRLARRA